MKTVRLINTNNNIEIQVSGRMDSESPNVDVGYEFDKDEYPSGTLRDLSIIAMSMFGQGVTWQLANELSKRLTPTNNPYEISEVLFEIFEEYSKLSEEQAYIRNEESPNLYKP